MKKSLLIISMCMALGGNAQADSLARNKVFIDLSWSVVGLNAIVGNEFKRKKCAFFAALTFHFNTYVRDRRQFSFRHRFYHTNIIEGLGLQFGWTRPINIRQSNLGLHLLFLNQINYLHVRPIIAECDTSNSSFTVQYVPYMSQYPMLAVTNCIGLGLNVKACNNVYFNASVSVGNVSIIERESYAFVTYRYHGEFTDYYKMGLSYLLVRKK